MKKKILIIEDSADICETLSSHLKTKGFEVILAQDGEKGLEKAKREKADLNYTGFNASEDGWIQSVQDAQV